MVKRILPINARSGKRRPLGLHGVSLKRVFTRAGVLSFITGLIGALSISPVADPQIPTDFLPAAAIAVASLNYAGGEISISGSVAQLFQSPLFVGPTADQKRSRLRPQISATEVAQLFVEDRTRIAALRSAPVDPVSSHQSVAPIIVQTTNNDETPRISIAAIDPALASAALLAIEQVIPIDPSIPQPNSASERLAYLRANTPTTEHAVNTYSERERWCLSTGIYFEARGESYRGQVGVAQVIMNRVKHRQYPNTICGVVFQNQSWKNRCQFSFACDGIPERVNDSVAWAKAEEITEKVTNGSLYLAEVANATHYHANYVYPHWAPRMKRLTRIGAHIFYRFRS